MNVSQRRLHYLYESARLGTMRAAGEKLDVAPSSISRQIAELESELGTPLVERGRRRLKLTEAGELAFQFYQDRCAQQEAFLSHIRELQSLNTGKISIAVGELETREFTPVGGTHSVPFDVRLISATNANLQEMIQENQFREDLLYRINTVEIAIPPLRDRKDDIPILLNHFLKKYSEKYKQKIEKFSSPALQKLKYYDWPGNVRELRHTVERAVIMSDSTIIDLDCFLLTKEESKSENLQLSDYNLEKIEQQVIEDVFRKYDGNISKMAEVLGLTRASLYRRLKKYDI